MGFKAVEEDKDLPRDHYRALIVEDDQIDYVCISRTIAKGSQPFRSDRAVCLQEVQPLLETSLYDVIISDINLPDSYGIDTINVLLALAVQTPIVVLSGAGDDSIALDAIHAGAQDYIPKRYLGDSELLKRMLRHAIERHQLKMRLEAVRDRERFLAHYDQCTFLPNRILFLDRLERSVLQAQRDKTSLSLMFIDLDRFKSVNDSLGHSAGDAVLKTIAGRVSELLRESDTTARFGGDEFVLILNNASEKKPIEVLANKIIQAVNQPVSYEHHFCYVGASVGVASYPAQANTKDELLAYADMAMYAAKGFGRNQVRFFDESMLDQKRDVMCIEAELKLALKDPSAHFEVYFQPLVDLNSEESRSAEALIRWSYLERVNVSTEQFIAFAEELGLVYEIDRWMLEMVCKQSVVWGEAVTTRVAVNLSSQSINRPSFVRSVVEPMLDEYGLSGSRLEIEITERVLLEDTHRVRKQLAALKSLGVTITVDDFGTGFSSLNYLNSFPVDALKIDGCFICDEHSTEKDQALLKAIVGLAKTLGLTVVAECIETRKQMDFIKSLGCDFGQGFFWCVPTKNWSPQSKAQYELDCSDLENASLI